MTRPRLARALPPSGAMRDDETESLRVEQGKPPRPDPRDRQGEVPLAFSSGGVLASGADDARADDAPEGVAESADATRAIERGAAEIAAERRAGAEPADDQAPPSSRS